MRGEEKWRSDRNGTPRGGWDGGGVPTSRGTLGGSEDQAFPLSNWAPGGLRGSRARSSSLQGPLQSALIPGA